MHALTFSINWRFTHSENIFFFCSRLAVTFNIKEGERKFKELLMTYLVIIFLKR